MTRTSRVTIMAAAAAAMLVSLGAAQTPADEASSANAPALAKQLGMYVFPAKNQSATQQATDEAACYNWAAAQTGVNPMGPAPNADSAAKAEAAKMNQATQGAAVVGGAKGAAAGTAIGAIAGNTGEGAAIGAVVGGLAGRRARKRAEQEAAVAGAQAAQAKEQQNEAEFKKAMTACLTAKGYSVN
ncbi:MAG TPA: glycine zipper domain-containing protein [Gemmatimonadales bacterium]|nr:glycine zipper domain-containing protein [Gemmatimonadales bacterium]